MKAGTTLNLQILHHVDFFHNSIEDTTKYLPHLRVSRHGTLDLQVPPSLLKSSSDVAVYGFTTELVAKLR